MQDKLNHKVHFRAEGDIISPSASEVLLRDNLITLLRDSGIEVIDDVEEGQRVLAAGNASIKQMTAKQKRALETVSFSQDKSYHQTVISSADGAKVLNNLDTLVKEYENSIHTKEKTFIGTLAEKLEAHKHGSNSEYASFETMNGRVITIRLANHNAKVSTFYNHGENEGISIVVTPKDNDKLTNDGTAHITEFYYNALKLRRADGQPLADIVRSIQHAIQYMEGFCTGSSPEYYEAQLHETSEYQAMMKCKKELESINKWIHKDDSDETLYLRYKENEYSLSVIDKNVIRDAAIRLRKGDTYDDIYQDYLHKSKAAEQRFQEISSGNESSFMKYRRTGGEVEARNTEKRRNMHPDDRRNTLAVSTEDVPREQQIINTPEKETPSSDSLSVSGSSSNCFNAQELKESEGNSTLIKESPVVADIDDNIKWSPDTADNYEEAEEEDDEEEVKHSIHL